MFLMKLLTSRIGLIGITLAIALSWHYIDKTDAVRSAREALADEVTIRTLEAERDAARLAAQVAKAANDRLQGQIAEADARAAQDQRELEAYERNTTINSDGIVDQSVLERLRNN